MKHYWKFIALFVVVLLLAACSSGGQGENVLAEEDAAAQELIPIRLPVGYIPNVQFAPMYVAVEKGYFAEAGFDVTFDYLTETDGVALVGQGEIPFVVASGEQVLLARAQGVPVVYVMAWYHDFAVGITAKQSSGIETPADLAGKKIGLPGLYGASYIGFRAFLSANGLTESDVVIDSIGYNQVELLAADQEDAVVIYVTNEPIQLEAQGYPVNTFAVADYMPLVANGVVTSETMIAENPEAVEAFVQAFLRGVADTIADPEEAFEICYGFVDNLAEADKDIQMQVLEKSIELWQSDTPGQSDPQAWENMQTVLLEMELLTETQAVEDAFTNQFVE